MGAELCGGLKLEDLLKVFDDPQDDKEKKESKQDNEIKKETVK